MTTTSLTGALLIGARDVTRDTTFVARRAVDGSALDIAFSCATPDDIRNACALADAAFDTYRHTSLSARATFLDAVATEIEALGEPLIERAHAESGLPVARLTGERGRTMGQLRMFASLLREGRCMDPRIDPALPDRKPMSRPDLRQIRMAVGPVAVFGASNFPLAFSAAGGDTASALAAGCPVVVRAHPAHPGTSELMGRAIRAAITRCTLPEGVFSLIGGPDYAIGATLVQDPAIMAVGYTGSRQGGLALGKIAAARPVPVPVYAEMSSINPVYLLPAALKADAETLGASFVVSLTMGAGQFCTNPGLILGVAGPDFDRFVAAAKAALETAPAPTMLTSGIRSAYEAGVERLAARPGIRALGRGPRGEDSACQAALFETDATTFAADPVMKEEIFGSCSLIVACPDIATLRTLTEALEGQLTATLHMKEADLEDARGLLPVLERKVGRILANAWPTGVEVCSAMVHGGPFPATSDPRTTSVGTGAIERFLRPVCYQDIPQALLPVGLRDGNQPPA
ncbi:aldehyde dehydrogenase (NADP(+)) [Brytella acorum]|uniref:Aldehyde dehydrogenase (NADP(+)) n=1 Tax=Brytella acorum TaxID=2959299 RepID=A0AA35V636_9PROT|nr:aldehyde dehydrogenase (NADP(+)) [Brytella acorum]MDF3623362.1 aldehyde dehydrogenase (NADP(+)) [Brytella acorum]CAI9120441.1 aldehyde dehydrogenase (NADP(+)) [Brytella acorum]